jgi:hypothetical protein
MIFTYREVSSLVKKDVGSILLLRRIEAGYMRLGIITSIKKTKYRVEVSYRDSNGEEQTISLESTDSVVLST